MNPFTEGYRVGNAKYGYTEIGWHSFIDAAILLGPEGLEHRCSCEWVAPANGKWPEPWPWQRVHVHRFQCTSEIVCANCGEQIALLQAQNPKEN